MNSSASSMIKLFQYAFEKMKQIFASTISFHAFVFSVPSTLLFKEWFFFFLKKKNLYFELDMLSYVIS